MNNPVASIKRFILRTLSSLSPSPMQEPAMDDAIELMVSPKPLLSEIHQARRELQADGLILGVPDDFDRLLVSWSLTNEGKHAAGRLR